MRRIVNFNAGFSLIEVIVVMAVFVIVLMITSAALNNVLTKGTIVQRSAESNIEGSIGLEMLRHDLAQAGLGLFTGTDNPPSYLEATGATHVVSKNDDPFSNPNPLNPGVNPRAIVTENNLLLASVVVLNGTDYLTIKSTTLGNNDAAQRWTYVEENGIPHLWGTNDFVAGDRMIALAQTFNAKKGVLEHSLVKIASANFEVPYANVANPDYTPAKAKRYYFYGVNTAAGAALRAPFNRVDYYVQRPVDIPTSCSPATGVLYKAVMSHANGTLAPVIPILDCVADMQIVLGWNTRSNPEGSNVIDILTNADGTTTFTPTGGGGLNGLSIASLFGDPVELRKRLRQIRVYILAQDGTEDLNFSNINTALPLADAGEGLLVQRAGQAVPGSVDLTTPNMLHYRWKVYRVVVKPKNLG